ncbi:hypothetical protein BG000_006319 [Podila horticola]|nr:hypothetical protein BG000_006319 [Podila horticola]
MEIILPCPANSHHAAIVQVLSLAPFGHRHQFSSDESSSSPSPSQGLLKNHSGNKLRRQDALRDEIAWGFVPAAFRPKLAPDKLDRSRSPRPTAADLVVSTPASRQASSRPTSESGSSPTKSTTRSPVGDWTTPAPSRKRQSSYSSPNDDARASIKRQVVAGKTPYKRHQIDDDDNPFSVQSNGNPPDIRDFLARPVEVPNKIMGEDGPNQPHVHIIAIYALSPDAKHV